MPVVLPFAFALAVLTSRRRDVDPFRATVRWIVAFVPLAAFALGQHQVHTRVHATEGGYEMLGEVVQWLYNKPVPVIVHGWFLVFGLVPVLFVALHEEVLDFARSAPHVVFVGVALLGLAYIGGDSTERLLTFATPAVFAIAGNAVSRRPAVVGVVGATALVVVQALTNRVFWSIPDWPPPVLPEPPRLVLLPIGESTTYTQLWSTLLFGSKQIELQMASLVQYGVVSFGLLLWCFVRKRSLGPRWV